MSTIKDALNGNTNCKIDVRLQQDNELSEQEKELLLQKYYQGMLTDYTTFPVLNNNKGMTLKDIYVEPNYQILSSQIKQEKNTHFGQFESINNDSIHSFLYQYLSKQISPNQLNLKNSRIILLLGQPGQGKSSFSKKFMFDYIEQNTDISEKVYLLRLRDIGQVNHLLENPLVTIGSKLNQMIGYLPDLNKESILVLDGLDELTMKEQLVTSTIDDFLETLIQTLKDFPTLKIILTSRTLYVNLEKINKKLKNDILTLHLKSFYLEHQLLWLDNYKKFYPDATLTDKILKELHKKSTQHIIELIEQPILLHMITELNFSKDDLIKSTNRAKIYNEMFNSIIKRKGEDKKEHENLKGIQPADVRDLLRTIAFEIYKSNHEYIHKSKLEKLPEIKEFYKNLDIKIENNEQFEGILKGVLISFYFQEVKKDGDDDHADDDNNNYAIEFLHKSLQEYLVAEKIFDEIFRLTEKDRKGKYFITDYTDVLKIIWELFSHKKISEEIKTYLIEILKNHENKEELNELAKRLSSFLVELFEKDFIYSFNLSEDTNPMQKSLNTFYGYWIILSNLGGNENYIHTDFKNKFAKYLIDINMPLHIVDKGTYSLETDGFNLSYQKLNEIWLSKIDLDNSNLCNINLESSIVNFSTFNSSNIQKSNFKNCSLYNAEMHGSNLSNSDFTNANLRFVNFAHTNLTNVNFTNVILDNAFLQNVILTDTIFNNTQLNDIYIDDENAEILKKQGIEFTINENNQ